MESDPRLAGPGTVRAWEETRIAGSISRCLSSFPGLLDLCAAPLLKCVHGMSGEGSPSSPVMSAGLKLLGGNFCMALAGLCTVFESRERLALLSLPGASSPNVSCFGSLLSSMRMTCLLQPSEVHFSGSGLQSSMLVDSAMSRTCRL